MKTCSVCDKPVVARGWCRLHYERWKRQGDPLATVRTSNFSSGARNSCAVAGCEKVSRSKGLCAVHYARQLKSGTTDLRPELNIGASKHPLSGCYKAARRRGVAPQWLVFENFVADVSPRPHDGAKLLRPRHDQPLGPDNFKWSARSPQGRSGLWLRPADKAWFDKNARRVLDKSLRRTFGIGVDEYEFLQSQQEDVCAICKAKPEGRRLSVDHCHRTGSIRGLLCSKCNAGLGSFNDQPDLLRAAIAYLGREPTQWTVRVLDTSQATLMGNAEGAVLSED